MKVQFLPQQWLFWVCHIGGWVCVSLPFVNMDVVQVHMDTANIVGGAKDGADYSWQTEVLRFLLTLPVLLWYRYLFNLHHWRQLIPIELLSLTLGFNIIFAILITYLLPFDIPPTEVWFEWFQRESAGTTREFDEKVISFLYSYIAQVMWCVMYIMFKSVTLNQNLEQQEQHMQGQLRTAKISSLAGQISPHFLFNAMNNICSLMDEDVSKAQTALRSFSDFLRFSFNDTEKQTIPLSEELTLVRNYIEVVSIQFEDKLDFSIEVAENVLQYAIPPMSIQLLVENAIKHGISKLKKGGFIKVLVESQDEHLTVTVHNSGVFTVGLNEMPTRTSLEKNENCGVGLKNIRERLKLVYGDRANFQIFQNEVYSGGIEVSQESPVVTAELNFPKINSFMRKR